MLQDALAADQDRDIFSRMVFLRTPPGRAFELTEEAGTSTISDRYGQPYTFRSSTNPRETGQLQRHFASQNIPRAVSDLDRYYVVLDDPGSVVGGICYRIQEPRLAQLDGIVVAAALQGRGIGSGMDEEFCRRMAAQGVEVVRAHFLRRFHLNRGYRVDRDWGTLVKFLK